VQATVKTIHSYEISRRLRADGVAEVTAELRPLLADTFALYVMRKNFHWHMTGRHFRENTRMSPRSAWLKTGSMKPSGILGFRAKFLVTS